MTGWRRSQRVAILVITLFAIVQLAIPISRFGGDETARFAWQMFSTYRPDPGFTVETGSGSVEIDLADYMARVRADIDLVAVVPDHLCSVVPAAVRVVWGDGVQEC